MSNLVRQGCIDVCGLQPVNFVSLGLTAATAAGLIYFYQHLRAQKLQGTVTHAVLAV